MQAPHHADRPTRQRVKPTWNGHPSEKTTNTPWYTPTANGTGWPKGKIQHPNRPQPPQRDLPPKHWTLYKQPAHARTLAEHSIKPYTDAVYVERMLQDWTNYGTEILEGHRGPPDTTPRTTWDSVVPDRDIGAPATTGRTPFEDCSKPDHPFGDDYDPAITNAILAYHSWSIKQSIHVHTPPDDPRVWHPVWPPALEVYLHENATAGAQSITSK